MRRSRLALATSLLACFATSAHAGERVQLPNPWQPGRTFEYATRLFETERADDGQHGVRAASDITSISITRVDAEGAHQAWRSRDSSNRVLDGEPSGQAIMLAATGAFAAIDVLVGPDGAYRHLENPDAIGAKLRTNVRPAVLAMVDDALQQVDAGARDAKRAEAERSIDERLARTTTPAFLEDSISGSFRDYNRFVGRTFEAGITQSEAVEVDSPSDGPDLPATLEYVLLSAPPGDRVAVIEWKRTLDVGRGRDLLWDAADAASGKTTAPEARVGVPPGLAVEDAGTVRIDRATGVVLSTDHTKRSLYAGKTKVSVEWTVLAGQHD